MRILSKKMRLLQACLSILPVSVLAADAIDVGTVVVDPPTLCCLGFALPIKGGDDNYNATVQVEYRKQGNTVWRTGFPLLRVRPETISTETPPGDFNLPIPSEEFAGSIFGLDPDTSYEVRFSVTDPDGGGTVQTVTAATRPMPRSTPANPRIVVVTNDTELDNALVSAQPGDVIRLAAGTYLGTVSIDRNGTKTNPIIVQGVRRDGVIIDASGNGNGVKISGDHVYLDRLTVTGSDRGVSASGVEGLVIRNSRFTDVDMGIVIRSSMNRDIYICDNVLEGRHRWPNISGSTWNSEGIVVTGQGHVVCHNTLSGFGDALGTSHRTSIRNLAIDFYGNNVLWTGDDGLELDYSHRNVRAFKNRITNANMGVSLQPTWGGPIYIFKNVFVNLARSPYKFNDEPSGFFVFNNTSIRTLADDGQGTFKNFTGYAWGHPGYQINGHRNYVSNFLFKDNLLVGLTGPARVTSDFNLADIDYNGWSPDGEFVFYDTESDTNVLYTNLAELQNRSAYEANGLILNSSTFKTPPNMPADYTTLVGLLDVTLHENSNSIDAGLVLPNINSDYVGGGPDLGAWERGAPIPAYGIRQSDTIPPAAPTDLRIE